MLGIPGQLLAKHQYLLCVYLSVLRSLRVDIMCTHYFVKDSGTRVFGESDGHRQRLSLKSNREILSVKEGKKGIPHEVWVNSSFHSQVHKYLSTHTINPKTFRPFFTQKLFYEKKVVKIKFSVFVAEWPNLSSKMVVRKGRQLYSIINFKKRFKKKETKKSKRVMRYIHWKENSNPLWEVMSKPELMNYLLEYLPS